MSKHTHTLKEIAKFGAGLIAGDFLVGVWLYSSPLIPLQFLGVTFTRPLVVGWMIIDLCLLAFLFYYGWHANAHSPSLKERTYFILIGLITGLIALVHLVRVVYAFEAHIGPYAVPFWVSWIGVVIAGYLSYASFRFAAGLKRK